MNTINRKNFILSSVGGAAGIILVPGFFSNNRHAFLQKKPVLDTALVKEFVGAAHKDIEKVKSMFQETPDLLNSVNNLGGWDWEDAIGAAGHVGIPELALYLLEKGARPTICVAAMLGKIDVVKAFISAYPQMKDAVGPHKISLVRHAKAGGENAKEVLEYLQSAGAKE
ncbi:MAG: hypothetical protein ACXWC7_02095 [Chitinophagaceae bacterium]